jgi:tetratricopeptide (TPR) repeat protein
MIKNRFAFISCIFVLFISCELPRDQEYSEVSGALINNLPAAHVHTDYVNVRLKPNEVSSPHFKITNLRASVVDQQTPSCGLLSRVRNCIITGKVDEARNLLLAELEKNPGNSKLLEILTTVELLDENWESAIDLADHVLRSEPFNVGFLEKKASSKFMLSDPYSAIEGFDSVVGILQEYSSTRNDFCDPLAKCCQNAGDKLLRAKSGIATVYYNMGDLEEAERLAREILAEKPDHVDAKFVLSLMLGKKGMLDDSMEIYRSILPSSPGNACVLNNMGVLHYRKKDLDTAMKYFEESYKNAGINRRTKSIACSNIADIHVLEKNYAEAEKRYLEATGISPRFSGAFFGLGELYDILGRDDEAKKNVKHALSLDPEGFDRFNSNYTDPEWEWHRDALIAEIQNNQKTANELWERIKIGNVPELKPVAERHLQKL